MGKQAFFENAEDAIDNILRTFKIKCTSGQRRNLINALNEEIAFREKCYPGGGTFDVSLPHPANEGVRLCFALTFEPIKKQEVKNMDLVKVEKKVIGEGEVPTVNARKLHEFLEIQTQFKDWISRRIEEYGFTEGKDFCSNLSESRVGRPSKDYHITLDMAKELSMVERNEKGKIARQYFIECEKQLKEVASPQHQLPRTHAEALRMLADTVEQVEAQQKALAEAAPKVAFANAVNDSSNSMDLGTFAKILGTGRTRLFEWLREQGYFMAGSTKPYQVYVDNGFFVVIETTFSKGDTTQSYGKTQICGKGQLAVEKLWRELHKEAA